jgi:tetratricopeptide (TPR) repeat protein
LELAGRFESEGKLVEAKEIYFRLSSLQPDNAELASRSGRLAASMKLSTAAINLLSRAVELRPEWPAYHRDLGEALGQVGRFSEAEEAFRAALKLSRDDPQVLSQLGLAVAQQGRLEEGIDSCRAAARSVMAGPIVHYHLGCVMAMAGKKDEGMEALQAALKADPSFAAARMALEELTNSKAQAGGT